MMRCLYATDYADEKNTEHQHDFRSLSCKAGIYFNTKNGYGNLDVMIMDTYEALVGQATQGLFLLFLSVFYAIIEK